MKNEERIIVYIDGSNLYYKLQKRHIEVMCLFDVHQYCYSDDFPS